MELLVVGAGAMGRWFGQAVSEELSESVAVVFHDLESEAAHEAAEAVGGRPFTSDISGPATTDGVAESSSTGDAERSPTTGDVDGPSTTGEVDERFDAVCIAVPIPAAEEAIASYGPLATEAIFDVTGTMTGPIAAMAEHARCERTSFHPLFAPANEPGNVPVVIDEGGPMTETVVEALENRGNNVFETTATEHDEAMRTVQARAHAAVLAFALAADTVPDRFQTPISAPLGELAAQVTDGESRVYADIQAAFDGASDVADAAIRLAEADDETFEGLYEQARWEGPE